VGPSRCERDAGLAHVPGGLREFARDLVKHFSDAPETLNEKNVLV
jgi:hypothetical protein